MPYLHTGETKHFSARIRVDIYERLYTLAFIKKRSMNSIVNDLLYEATKKASGTAVQSKPDASRETTTKE